MAESQITPLFKSHPDIYQRFLDQFDYTIDHPNDPIRVCVRSLDNIIPRLHGNGINDTIIGLHLEGSRTFLSSAGEDEHLHPFCYLECSILEYRPMARFYPRRKHGFWETGGWPLESSWLDRYRHQILPELIDLSDDAEKERRVRGLKHSPIANPWEDYGTVNPLRPAAIDLYITDMKPYQLEELYSLRYIKLRKYSGDHNMGHEEAHKEAYNRTSEQYWEWRNRTVCREYMQLTITRRDEAIAVRSEPTTDYENESEDDMDIDDEDVALSPVDEMFGLEVYGEPQRWLQRSRKRLFDDDDDDEANQDVTNKRGKFTHW